MKIDPLDTCTSPLGVFKMNLYPRSQSFAHGYDWSYHVLGLKFNLGDFLRRSESQHVKVLHPLSGCCHCLRFGATLMQRPVSMNMESYAMTLTA